jgi:hypothetical protein
MKSIFDLQLPSGLKYAMIKGQKIVYKRNISEKALIYLLNESYSTAFKRYKFSTIDIIIANRSLRIYFPHNQWACFERLEKYTMLIEKLKNKLK